MDEDHLPSFGTTAATAGATDTDSVLLMSEAKPSTMLMLIISETPWPSLAVGLLLLVWAQFGTTVQQQNYPVTVHNEATFAMTFATTEHVPTIAFIMWGVAMAVVFVGIELFIVRSGRLRQRLVYGLTLCFLLLETFFITMAITTFGKRWAAEPRPDFLARCIGSVDGNATFSADGSIICTHAIGDGRESFPSGHSSGSVCIGTFSSFYFLYLIYYRRVTLPWRDINGRWFNRWIQRAVDGLFFVICFWPLFFASYVVCSRVVDHRHSAADVTAGSLLGFVCAVLWFARALSLDYAWRHNSSVRVKFDNTINNNNNPTESRTRLMDSDEALIE